MHNVINSTIQQVLLPLCEITLVGAAVLHRSDRDHLHFSALRGQLHGGMQESYGELDLQRQQKRTTITVSSANSDQGLNFGRALLWCRIRVNEFSRHSSTLWVMLFAKLRIEMLECVASRSLDVLVALCLRDQTLMQLGRP